MKQLEEYLGIKIQKNIYLNSNDPLEVYRNAVHPEIGLHIVKEAIKPSPSLDNFF